MTAEFSLLCVALSAVNITSRRFSATGAAGDEVPRMARAFAVAVDEAAAMVIDRFLRWRGTRALHHEVVGIDAI